MSQQVFAGWDVGGWNCDKNAKSRDAIVLLDADGCLIGKPWRGNLSASIEEAIDSAAWIATLHQLCQTMPPTSDVRVTLAIDTPLAFSEGLLGLINHQQTQPFTKTSDQNRYLYRKTERLLASTGKVPLSPIKDMIGSQATKGMHVLAKFAPRIVSTGVWTDEVRLTTFEAYPAVSREAPVVQRFALAVARQNAAEIDRWHDDMHDALTCAIVAWLFANRPEQLEPPPRDVPKKEGWIWRPRTD